MAKDKKHAKRDDKSKEPSRSPDDLSFVPSENTLREEGGPLKLLVSANDKLNSLSGKYHVGRHRTLAGIYAVACFYRDDQDSDAWQDFCRHEDWTSFKGKRPKIEDRTDTLRPVLRFATGLNNPEGSKLANKYLSALSPAFQRNIAPIDIPQFLHDGGGIEVLAQGNRRRKREDTSSDDDSVIVLRTPLDEGIAAELLLIPPDKPWKMTFTIVRSRSASAADIKVLSLKAKS